MNKASEERKKNTSAQESAATLRVTLCKEPELAELHRKAIQDFEVAYIDYEAKVKAQGSATAKPILKAMCVTRVQREVIALIKGIKFKDLTHELIYAYIEEIKREQYGDVQIDERNVFKEIEMRSAKDVNDIGVVIAEFYVKVNERTQEAGLTSRFLEDYESKELRKQSFPTLLKAVWPKDGVSYLTKKWVSEGKKWSLKDLMAEVKVCARTYGPYELLKGYGTRNNGNEGDKGRPNRNGNPDDHKSKWTSYTRRYKKQGEVKPPNKSWTDFKKNKPPGKSHDNKKWMSGGGTQKIVCFKCGQPGHKRPECKLADDNGKVLAHQKKYNEAKSSLRKLGMNFMVN